MTEHSAFGYIPEDQKVQTQPDIAEQSPSQENTNGKWLKRIKPLSPLMAAVLAVGLYGSAKAQGTVDLLNGTGSYETTCPVATPPQWNPITEDAGFPPTFDCNGNGVPANVVEGDGQSSVEVNFYSNGTACNTNAYEYANSFPFNPNVTQTLSYWTYHLDNPGEATKSLVTIVTKDAQNNVTGALTFNPIHNFGSGFEESYSQVFGAGGEPIPPNTVSATIQVGLTGTSSDCTTSGIKGREWFDIVQIQAPAPTPTPPASVGGIAEIPNLPPASMTEHTQDEKIQTAAKVVGVAGSVFAAAGVIELERRRRNKKQHD